MVLDEASKAGVRLIMPIINQDFGGAWFRLARGSPTVDVVQFLELLSRQVIHRRRHELGREHDGLDSYAQRDSVHRGEEG